MIKSARKRKQENTTQINDDTASKVLDIDNRWEKMWEDGAVCCCAHQSKHTEQQYCEAVRIGTKSVSYTHLTLPTNLRV